MMQIERDMAVADRLLASQEAGVAERYVDLEIGARPYLSVEQREAVEHVTGDGRIAVVVGLAGPAKHSVACGGVGGLKSRRLPGAWSGAGSKAAEGLEESSGIVSRTPASWQQGWQRDFDPIGTKDVFMIDEAGMVGSRQLAGAS